MKILKFITDYMAVGVLLAGILGVFYPEIFTTFKAITPYLLGFVMFGMGLGLSFHDFFNVVTNPKTVIFGILMQFVMMPLIAVILTQAIHIQPEFAVGMLSVSITICTTLLSPIVTPAIFYLIAHNSIEINFWAIVLDILKMVVAPVFIGVLINALLNTVAKKIFVFMPFISSVTIMAIVAIVCALSAEKIGSSSILLFVIVCMHNILGIVVTYIISRLCKFNKQDSRTLAIEVGTQNSGLGIILSLQHLTAFAAVVGAIFSVVQNIIGSIFAGLCKHGSTTEYAVQMEVAKDQN